MDRAYEFTFGAAEDDSNTATSRRLSSFTDSASYATPAADSGMLATTVNRVQHWASKHLTTWLENVSRWRFLGDDSDTGSTRDDSGAVKQAVFPSSCVVAEVNLVRCSLPLKAAQYRVAVTNLSLDESPSWKLTSDSATLDRSNVESVVEAVSARAVALGEKKRGIEDVHDRWLKAAYNMYHKLLPASRPMVVGAWSPSIRKSREREAFAVLEAAVGPPPIIDFAHPEQHVFTKRFRKRLGVHVVFEDGEDRGESLGLFNQSSSKNKLDVLDFYSVRLECLNAHSKYSSEETHSSFGNDHDSVFIDCKYMPGDSDAIVCSGPPCQRARVLVAPKLFGKKLVDEETGEPVDAVKFLAEKLLYNKEHERACTTERWPSQHVLTINERMVLPGSNTFLQTGMHKWAFKRAYTKSGNQLPDDDWLSNLAFRYPPHPQAACTTRFEIAL